MRTSRGLQITSLIVLSPVLLILLSLLIILFTTLYSQLKIWCSPLLPYYDPSLSKITTTAFSTMTYYNNTSSSIMYENAPESKSPSSSMTDTTPSRPSTSSSSNITDIHHPPNSFFRLKGLKRKSSTSLLLAYFGITLFVGIFYFQKIHMQKCQNDQLKRDRIKQWVYKNGKKIKKFIYGLLLFSEETEETATAAHEFFMKDNHRFNQNDDSYSSKKEHVQQKLFTTQTSTATNHSHSHRHLVNKKSKKQLQQQRNRSPLGSKKQPNDSTKLLSSQQQEKESICVINTTEKNNSHDKNYSAYRDDWINVGEKKKKSVLSSTTYEKTNSNNMSNRILHHDHKKPGNMNKNDENNMEKNVFIEDDDADDVDDDKTIVDDDDIFISTDLSSNNTSDLELGSPNLSSTETIVSPDDSFTIKKMDQQPSSHLTTHIKHWYSPFSTGLKIDMLPKYNDPLTKLDPIQLRRNDLPSFTRSHHYDQDKFHLLQSHPFISHSNKLNQHSSSLGVIGQQQQYTSHVQNSSKSNLYSLFI